MASTQLKTLKEKLNQKKDEIKKLEETIRDCETEDLERHYQEKQKVHFVFSLIYFILFSFLSKKLNAFTFYVLIRRYNNLIFM